MELLQDTVADDGGGRAHWAALMALSHAAKWSGAVQEAAVAAGCVPRLAALVRELAQKEAIGMDDQAFADLAPAVGILATLASNHAEALLSSDAVDALAQLVQLVQWDNPHASSTRGSAMHALYRLAHQHSGRRAEAAAAIAAAGGIAAAVQCLRSAEAAYHQSYEDFRVPQMAAGLLASMAEACPQMAADIRAAGAVPRLEHMLHHSPTTEERGCAVAALASLRRAAAIAAVEEIAAADAPPGEHQAASLKPPRICAAPGCCNTRGLRKCGGCHTVRYCSQECCRAHWPEHRAECRRLQAEAAAKALAAGSAED